MTKFFSPDAQRGDLNRLLKTLGIDPSQFLVQPYLIRLEKELDAARSNYEFDFLANKASDRPGEVKLDRNDAFAILGVRLGVFKQDVTLTPKQYVGHTFYYPDPNFFEGAPAGQVTEAVSLEVLWNSLLSIKSQNVDRIRDLHTNLLKHVPERGYIEAAASGNTYDEFPQQHAGIDNFFRLMPNPVISGQDNNRATLVLGSGNIESIEGTHNSTPATVTTRNVVALEFYGFLIVDAAKPAQQWNTF